LVAGFLTLSNAGYLAIGGSIFAIYFLETGRQKKLNFVKQFFFLFLGIILIWFSLFSRSYFSSQSTEFKLIYAISGANMTEDDNYDPSSGRVDLLEDALKTTSKNIIGAGIQPTDAKGLKSSASAPIFWFVMTGFPGLFLLILMQFALFAKIRSKISENHSLIFLVQALIVVMVQQLVYGSWMDPNYLILTSAVLISINKLKNRV
jgi:hypothetical protein